MNKAKAGKMLTKLRPDMKAWNAMTEADRALLTKLGIKPKLNRKTPVARATKKLKPYSVKAIVSCGLCYAKTIEYFRMIPINFGDDAKGEPHLRSKKITFHELKSPIKNESHNISNCKQCREILLEQGKDELITTLIEYARAVSCAWNRR